MTEPDTLPLLIWLSPAFPVGGFAYSHGLEWAVEDGDIHDVPSCAGWIGDLLTLGSGYNDALLLAAAYRAVWDGDDAALVQAAELSLALQPGAERRLETAALGTAFLTALRVAWPCPALDRLELVCGREIAYPVAVGGAAAGHGLALAATLEAYLLAFVSALVSAAVRLGPIGQSGGLRITAGLLPRVRSCAAQAAAGGLEELGGCSFRSDIASLRHETQYTRLFRS